MEEISELLFAVIQQDTKGCVGKVEGEAITTGLGVGVAITMGRGVGVRTNTLFWKIMLVTVSSVILPV